MPEATYQFAGLFARQRGALLLRQRAPEARRPAETGGLRFFRAIVEIFALQRDSAMSDSANKSVLISDVHMGKGTELRSHGPRRCPKSGCRAGDHTHAPSMMDPKTLFRVMFLLVQTVRPGVHKLTVTAAE